MINDQLKDNEEYIPISIATVVVKISVFFHKTFKIRTNGLIRMKDYGMEIWDFDNKKLMIFPYHSIILHSVEIIEEFIVDKDTREIIRREKRK